MLNISSKLAFIKNLPTTTLVTRFVYNKYDPDETTSNKSKNYIMLGWKPVDKIVDGGLPILKDFKDVKGLQKFENYIKNWSYIFKPLGTTIDGVVNNLSNIVDLSNYKFEWFVEDNGDIIKITDEGDKEVINDIINERLNKFKTDGNILPEKGSPTANKISGLKVTLPERGKIFNSDNALMDWFDIKGELSEIGWGISFEAENVESSGFTGYVIFKHEDGVLKEVFFERGKNRDDYNVLYNKNYKYEIYPMYHLKANELYFIPSSSSIAELTTVETSPPDKLHDVRLYPLPNNKFLLTWGHIIERTGDINKVNILYNNKSFESIDYIKHQHFFEVLNKEIFVLSVRAIDVHANASQLTYLPKYDNINKKFMISPQKIDNLSEFKKLAKAPFKLKVLDKRVLDGGYLVLTNINEGGKEYKIPLKVNA